MEGQVRRLGGFRGQAAEVVGGREHAVFDYVAVHDALPLSCGRIHVKLVP